MTRAALEKELKKIGYRITNSYNGLNDFIINNKGEETSFVLSDDIIEIRQELFGSSFQGNFKIKIKSVKIRSIRSVRKIDGISLVISKDCWISFYNHDIK